MMGTPVSEKNKANPAHYQSLLKVSNRFYEQRFGLMIFIKYILTCIYKLELIKKCAGDWLLINTSIRTFE